MIGEAERSRNTLRPNVALPMSSRWLTFGASVLRDSSTPMRSSVHRTAQGRHGCAVAPGGAPADPAQRLTTEESIEGIEHPPLARVRRP